MEKNLLIQNLKSKAGVDNLSDRTYDEVATLFLPQFTEDDKITDESYAAPLQVLKTMSGQLRHEVADGITKGKTQWETEQKAAQQKAIMQKLQDENGKGKKPNVPEPKNQAEMDFWARVKNFFSDAPQDGADFLF